jgi:anti-sigma regulatory factor (Ser/Thr protein kinase)
MHRHFIMDSKWTTHRDARAVLFSGGLMPRVLETGERERPRMATSATSAAAGHQTGDHSGGAVLCRLTLPGRPDHVREARSLVAKALGDLHPRRDDAVLMASELVTNAVLHTDSRRPDGTVMITVMESAGGVRVEVADSGSELTAPMVRADVFTADGHGLFLVQSLADQWGYLRNESGTTVWFWLARA